ncbi:MAG: hypothetical protein QOH23_1422 [Gaiellaceae bacterium]|nr:hypothetical protein [Gaiellaceae bacterium]
MKVPRLSAPPEDLHEDVRHSRMVREEETDELALQLSELAHQAALIARHVSRLRERPLFARDDISERQADELETRLKNLRETMAAVRAGRRAP